jgi:hypothetical protein
LATLEGRAIHVAVWSQGGSGALFALIGAGVLLGVACGGGRDAAGALEAAEPYLERFDRFDGWARRALSAGSAMGSRAMFEETLFAPILLDRGILDAWVTRARIAPRRWSLRGSALPGVPAGWISVRHPTDGPLSVLEIELDGARGTKRPALLIGRTSPGPSGAVIEVVVAFLREGTAGS